MMESSRVVLTEGGVIERVRRSNPALLDPFILHAGMVYEEAGRKILGNIYREYMEIGRIYGLPFISLAPTWRANPERLALSGYSGHPDIVFDCVDFIDAIRQDRADQSRSIFIGGMMACRGDAYRPSEALSKKESIIFHQRQAKELATSAADFVMAATLPAYSEAWGIASVLARHDRPYVLSFVVRSDGTLLDGTPLIEAVDSIDSQIDPPPFFYMINCVHPAIFEKAFLAVRKSSEAAAGRILGLQANTSARDPGELEGLPFLDTSEPGEFADLMAGVHRSLGIKVLGGCCGSDASHIAAIAERVCRGS